MNTNDVLKSLGKEFIPPQKVGSEINAVERMYCETEEEAIVFFEQVKERLLNVNEWKNIAVGKFSDFYLTDASGKCVDRLAQENDRIKINIPGPAGIGSDGHDWVVIERIVLSSNSHGEVLSMVVLPTSNPNSGKLEVAHFLANESTSTFQVKRVGNVITAEEHGRNEIPNAETHSPVNKLRNSFIAWGAKLGLSYPQWKALVGGLVRRELYTN